ncbi:MAG: hypothetical protein ACYC8V_14910, partial [Caulobacteraceae bacterium]
MSPPPASRRTLVRAAVVGAVAAAAAAAGYWWLHRTADSAWTDDAYVRAQEVVVAPKVRGMIEQVMVSADQTVRAGEPMARIDPAEYEARLAGAKGESQATR